MPKLKMTIQAENLKEEYVYEVEDNDPDRLATAALKFRAKILKETNLNKEEENATD